MLATWPSTVTAILMVEKNKMDRSVGIAIGSTCNPLFRLSPVADFFSPTLFFFGARWTLEFTLP